MNIRVSNRADCGITLIDCLVYMALFGLVTGLATACAFKLERQSREMRQRAEEISRALKAGERWRADIRSATNHPMLVPYRGQSLLRIQTKDGDVLYFFESGNLWRKPAQAREFGLFLPDVKQCSVTEDRRRHAAGWLCEIELATKRKQGKMLPLFSFRAVDPRPE